MKPLIVDYDGTYIKVDSLVESFFILLLTKPFKAILLLKYIKNIPKFKRYVLETNKSGDLIPKNIEVLEFLKVEKKIERSIHLVSGSNESFIKESLDEDSIFDSIHGTSENINLVGKKKLGFIKSEISEDFDYIGDSFKDIPIWKASNKAYVVNPNFFFKIFLKRFVDKDIKILGKEKYGFSFFVKFLRAHQWVKNLLIFVPILLSKDVGLDTNLIFLTTLGSIFLSFTASGGYIINDVIDINADRMHNSKKNRSIASGSINIINALLIAVLLICSSLFLSKIYLGNLFFLGLLSYLLLSIFYSLIIKKITILDILMLSNLFTLRIFLGILIQGDEVSFWLLVFSVFFFLSLASLKRFVEVLNFNSKEPNDIKIPGRGYIKKDKDFLFSIGMVSGLLSIFLLFLFFTAQSDAYSLNYQIFIHSLVTLVMLFWLMRMWFNSLRKIMVEDPISFAIKDRTSILLGIFVIILIIYA